MRIENGYIHLPKIDVHPGTTCGGCLYNSQGDCCAGHMILNESARRGNPRAVADKLTQLVEDRVLMVFNNEIFCPENIFGGTVV